MSSPSTPTRSSPIVLATTFQITMWTLSIISTLFLASRFAIRVSAKGRLMLKDYSLVFAIPMLFIAAGLLHTILAALYQLEDPVLDIAHQNAFRTAGNTSRLTAVIELLWIVIYCVKFCFLAQFKLYRPPYAYVNAYLTKSYWVMVAICAVSLVFTIIVPIVLCPNQEHCRYAEQSGNSAWEVIVTVLDIITDLLVIILPIFLIRLAKTPLLHALIDGAFKTLSIFAIIIAVIRLALQYDTKSRHVNYITVIYLLVIEATIALIMASITSYRTVLLDYLKKTGRIQKVKLSNGLEEPRSWRMARLDRSSRTTQDKTEGSSLAELPMLKPVSPGRLSPV
ncbi:hypothetical protein DM02DRAFT_651894 [Periconia macrospinosa]|uniref:Rhodopsin domain-containing protein n=1 Tax=Periconia macrospinosa TaxID=97972 RepID=A0A2V1E348_9PLEO|nr:hypothetical protein DM02DRAFT_651894 [Periconia macrospinosa]